MFIETEDTPNPASMKFLPGCAVLTGGSVDFRDRAAAETLSPLATRLFNLAGVRGVFLGADFVTVTKTEDRTWPEMRAPILAALMDHFTQGLPVMAGENKPTASTPDAEDDDITRQIKELLDTRVRPAVAQDGGDITFDRFEEGIVYLHLKGSCSGCPSSTATLKAGIENLLRHYVPEVTEVRPVR